MIVPVSGGLVIATVGKCFTDRRPLPAEHSWLTAGVFALRRGAALNVPLAWARDAEPTEQATVRKKLSALCSDVGGPARSVDLTDTSDPVDSTGSYRQQLQKSRADRAEWWTLADGTTIALVWTRAWPSVAVHVIPASWVDETLTTEPVPDVDLSWNWKQVMELDHVTIDPT